MVIEWVRLFRLTPIFDIEPFLHKLMNSFQYVVSYESNSIRLNDKNFTVKKNND